MRFRPFEELFEIPLRNGLTKPKRVRGEGFKMVNMGELFAHPRINNAHMDRVPLSDKEKESSMLEDGDLLYARQSLVREGAGQCSIFVTDEEEVCFESHIIRCRLNQEVANPFFYYYFFRSFQGKQVIDAIIEQGAGASGIRGSDLAKLQIPYIEKEIQDEIASQLCSIDDKVELNRQINQTLEQIAQAIFKSWFVDFEPVKAKIQAKQNGQDPERAAMRVISGKTDEELEQLSKKQYQQLAETAALFPEELEDSEFGEIPKGWEWSTIGDEVEVVGGSTPSTKNPDFWEGGEINWTSPKDLSGLKDKVLIKTEKKITKAGLEKISSGLLPVDTVLMSSRAPVGYLAMAKIPVAVNQGYIAMKCSKRLPPEYVLLWADAWMDEIKSRASGSTFAEISKKNFRPINIVVPDNTILNKYSKQTKSIFDMITESVVEIESLLDIRNSLLPKLLSGMITVNSSNKDMEVA